MAKLIFDRKGGNKMTKITDVVDLEKQGEIAVLMIYNPPVNALSVGVRKGMADGV
jgi:hypothetical protein